MFEQNRDDSQAKSQRKKVIHRSLIDTTTSCSTIEILVDNNEEMNRVITGIILGILMVASIVFVAHVDYEAHHGRMGHLISY